MPDIKKTAAPAKKVAEAPKKLEAPAPVKAVEAPKAPVAAKAPAAAKAAPAKKAVAKKAPAKKTAEKKPATKNAAAPKNVKVNVIVEHHGRQVDTASITKTAEKLWTMAGHDAAKISKVELYIKQEDGAVYCVVNGEAVGKYDL